MDTARWKRRVPRTLPMRGVRARAVALTLVAAAGCGHVHVVMDSPPSEAGQRAAVEAATTAFHQALRTNALETFVSFVADDVFFMPPGEPPIRGKISVRNWMTGFLSQYRTTALTLADREVIVGGGWAIELGSYEWGLLPIAGGDPIVDRGNYMQVWKEQPDGSWRFAREIYNSSVPPTAAAE